MAGASVAEVAQARRQTQSALCLAPCNEDRRFVVQRPRGSLSFQSQFWRTQRLEWSHECYRRASRSRLRLGLGCRSKVFRIRRHYRTCSSHLLQRSAADDPGAQRGSHVAGNWLHGYGITYHILSDWRLSLQPASGSSPGNSSRTAG
jgi:hypothetical protein